MVKLYTKTGDAGETGLLGGNRVPKDDARVEAYGQVDELNAQIGFALALDPPDFAREVLETVQRDLFTIGAELAVADPVAHAKRLPERLVGLQETQVLEQAIDHHDGSLPRLRTFILPGGTPKAAALHVARAVCRRAERTLVALARQSPVSPTVLAYVNRLSDLLFVLARAANQRAGRPDIPW
jgi:cob(I)alamin adenosyltransferase